MARFTVFPDLIITLRNWSVLLRNLTFSDNFKGYEWTGEIVAGETKQITHPLKVVPTRFLTLDNIEGGLPVFRPGSPKATTDFFYVSCASNFRGKLLILP